MCDAPIRWALELQRLKRTYPHKLAIVYVTASWERVVRREARRGEQTGRRIPHEVLLATFRQVPDAVAQLRGIIDEFIEVDNDQAGGWPRWFPFPAACPTL